MPEGIADTQPGHARTGAAVPPDEIRDSVLASLASVETDNGNGSLVDAGIIDQVGVDGDRVEISLRPITPASSKAEGPTYQAWDAVRRAVEDAHPAVGDVSIRVLWEDPWAP